MCGGGGGRGVLRGRVDGPALAPEGESNGLIRGIQWRKMLWLRTTLLRVKVNEDDDGNKTRLAGVRGWRSGWRGRAWEQTGFPDS